MRPTTTFYLLASITTAFMASSSAPTPLYALYQAQWGFSAATIGVIFGVYALAVLLALLVAGRLSDHVGRRPVLLFATAAQAATMLLFVAADGLATLLVARVIQGLITGAAMGAVGAGLLDLDKQRGTVANAVAPPVGTASGAMLSGILVQALPMPTHLVYLVLAGVFMAQFVGVWRMSETSTPRAGAWASLRPTMRVPAAARASMLVAIPVLVATWALAGFYASLAPAVVKGMLGSESPVVGGLMLFVLGVSASIAILLLHRREPQWLLRVGSGALIAGVFVTIAAMARHDIALFFIGSAVAGAGFGAGFQGAVRSVVSVVAPHERAGVLSVAYIVSYLAMGLPAIIAGSLVTHGAHLLLVARDFGIVVMALAAIALAASLSAVAPRELWRRRTAE